jgi:hypothetical protein
MVFSRPGYTFLFSMVFLSVFLPGASAMLSVVIYKDRAGNLPPPE